MARKAPPANPFYVLLVLAGVAFTVTACAYGVMTYRATHPRQDLLAGDAEHPLWQTLDAYGLWILLGEIALLALFTFAAISTDDFWQRRAERRSGEGGEAETPDE